MRELHAAGNPIGSSGVAALAEQLHAAPRLTALVLGTAVGGNAIGDDGGYALARALRLNAGRDLAVKLRGHAFSTAVEEELRLCERDCNANQLQASELRITL